MSNERRSPDWEFYRRNDQGVTAFRFPLSIAPFFQAPKDAPKEIFIEGRNAFLTKTGTIENAIDKNAFGTIRKLLGAFNVHLEQPKSLLFKDGTVLLPIESHLICASAHGLLAIESESGLGKYLEEENSLRERHQQEAELLHSAQRFNWSGSINDDRFEELIRDILLREPGVRRARRIGSARASDGGRDLMVDWLMSPAPWEVATEERPFVSRKVIVQCKAFKQAINRAKIGDIPGTADLHDAGGYLLVAFPHLTPSAIDYLTKVPAKRQIWADWWTKPEIEDRLRKNLDIAARFADLVTTIP